MDQPGVGRNLLSLLVNDSGWPQTICHQLSKRKRFSSCIQHQRAVVGSSAAEKKQLSLRDFGERLKRIRLKRGLLMGMSRLTSRSWSK
jgi:hypothetical protein